MKTQINNSLNHGSFGRKGSIQWSKRDRMPKFAPTVYIYSNFLAAFQIQFNWLTFIRTFSCVPLSSFLPLFSLLYTSVSLGQLQICGHRWVCIPPV